MAHTLTPGTIVRYDNGRGTGPAGPGSIGKVTRTDSAIGWPVVYFPWTHGPYSEYACSPSTLTVVDVATLTDREHWALGV